MLQIKLIGNTEVSSNQCRIKIKQTVKLSKCLLCVCAWNHNPNLTPFILSINYKRV
jgi:hypothetical protein